jgi:flagellar basal-body rod modification protein FlgD
MTINSTSSSTTGAVNSGVQLTSKSKNEQMGKSEFLTLLVTQLKNQDPEAPLDSKEFAVQLAQFTQVEKLISIESMLAAQNSAASAGSMASYLGHNVVLNSSQIDVAAGKASQIQLDLAKSAQQVNVQLVNARGIVVGQKQLGAMQAGKQIVSLSDLGVADGPYTVKVTASNTNGSSPFPVNALAVGLVSGFVPGPDPKLLVGSREIKMADVKEVALNQSRP